MSALTSGYDDVTSFSATLAAILEVGVVKVGEIKGSQDVFCQVYIRWILKVSFWNYNTSCANVKRGSCRSYSWSWGVPDPSPTQNESYVIMWYADGKTHCNYQTFRWVLPMKLMRDLILTQSTSFYSNISSVCYTVPALVEQPVRSQIFKWQFIIMFTCLLKQGELPPYNYQYIYMHSMWKVRLRGRGGGDLNWAKVQDCKSKHWQTHSSFVTYCILSNEAEIKSLCSTCIRLEIDSTRILHNNMQRHGILAERSHTPQGQKLTFLSRCQLATEQTN